MLATDSARIRLEHRNALRDHPSPGLVARGWAERPLDLELHLEGDGASMLSNRDHIIQVTAGDPLLQPDLGDGNIQAGHPVTPQQGRHDHSRDPVLIDSTGPSRRKR
jgi:hypothetical protein